MRQPVYIGVDGGGTKTIIRVEDENGRLLGREIGGPGNVRFSVENTWQVINAALDKILKPLSIDINDKQCCFHAGMGLAGCEIKEAYHAFLAFPHPMDTLVLASDAHTTCLAAHEGKDGAIIIAGTGVVGYQMEGGQTYKVGGWGFPLDDEGGGAWLGLQAAKITLRWIDGRMVASLLAKKIYAHFSNNVDHILSFSNISNATSFATLAPFVVEASREGDDIATQLLQQAAYAIDQVAEALEAARSNRKNTLPCSLVGSITPFFEPYLSDELKSRLRPSILSPDIGAMLLIREHLKSQKNV